MKFDQGKPRVDLIDPRFLLELGEVLGFGAEKYGENNWQAVEPKRYKAAALRHMCQYCAGEKVDKESGKSHLVHAACNLMFLYWSDNNEVRSESDGSLGDARSGDCRG
nr:MAG TPA: hypothetical protein [Caudoviricetes sp.]